MQPVILSLPEFNHTLHRIPQDLGGAEVGFVQGLPEDALREVLLNALIHRDYAVGAPIQIRVYPDKLRIWNPGHLPDGWTVAKLLAAHPSQLQ